MIVEFLELLQDDRTLKPEKRAESRFFRPSLQPFETYFGIVIFEKILSLTNPVHPMCQGREITVGDVRKLVNSLVTVLSSQAFSNENALIFYKDVKKAAGDLRLDQRQPFRLCRATEKSEEVFQ
ncbi:Zinc finger MYM-type protein 1-like [Oopsacas minuta]|uniref:Zinc finger MYM-type protein 1-like n=1 Tax=Oopsacas minuta TaxID=111878 RepID=A0AAV7JE82_9METZ|nr:Zinc finger MYM-type protein 1-like [Oopsacas minuta]